MAAGRDERGPRRVVFAPWEKERSPDLKLPVDVDEPRRIQGHGHGVGRICDAGAAERGLRRPVASEEIALRRIRAARGGQRQRTHGGTREKLRPALIPRPQA